MFKPVTCPICVGIVTPLLIAGVPEGMAVAKVAQAICEGLKAIGVGDANTEKLVIAALENSTDPVKICAAIGAC